MAGFLSGKHSTASEDSVDWDSRPAKKAKLLDIDESSEAEVETELNINEGYARRFEHNKKRAELHRLEEKYGKDEIGDEERTSDDSSSDESEDDAAEFATEALDAEISATVEAIRAKDPRIYNKDAKFYSELENAENVATDLAINEAPLYLRDYHRKNLLDNGANDQIRDTGPLPYVLEQEALKRDLVKEIHTATVAQVQSDDGAEVEDDLLVRVKKAEPSTSNSRPPIPDPKLADREPETFLSNFLASRAWVPTETSTFQPLESDDDDDLARAEEFEQAFNLRFEDPETSNKKLMTHSRSAVEKHTVRREEKGGRRKARDREKAKKMEEKAKRSEDRKRLKLLRIREMEEKLEKIRDAASLGGKLVKPEDWSDMLEGDWDDDKWNEEMSRRFGDNYYEDGEAMSVDGDAEMEEKGKAKKKVKKPKWADELDIKDLVPDFEDDEALPNISLSEDDGPVADSKSAAASRAEAKASSRRDRRIIEALAEQSLPLDDTATYSKSPATFRYRDTSPTSFGLTALDILAAEDSQLNEFAGLKKLATFRDPERKKKDKKRLSKKARLREWRKETFGREDGPAEEEFFGGSGIGADNRHEDDEKILHETSSKKHKKRKRKSKGKSQSTEV